jgi:putative membrane protein
MIRSFVRGSLAMLALSITFVACSNLGNEGATGGAGGGSVSSTDQGFVMMAAQASWAEIVTGQIAQKNAGSDAVRQFGQRMVQDHGMANQELASIAGKLGITLPKDPDAKHQADAKMLERVTGPEFDSQYSKQMVMDHEVAVALFEKQSKGGDDPSLRQFSTKYLPILQEHLKMARALGGQSR